MSVQAAHEMPASGRCRCVNCHRNRFTVYVTSHGNVVLTCYSCGLQQEIASSSPSPRPASPGTPETAEDLLDSR